MRKFLVLAVLASLPIACSKPGPPPAPPPPYDASLPVKEVMDHVVDPAARVFWASSGTIITAKGDTDLTPTTEAGWTAAESGAATVAESGNLLMLPGRARDNGAWMTYAAALTKAGLAAKKAAETHDRPAMFTTGGQIYDVCTACHRRYLFGLK